eukprot:CAMPEP_0170526538 /NCGR_PEP_ID=MMETSP0209-20121228/11931_1 /TAXON_ID=665100 ORGANISM="Litonotus pictus, Strain P1" /NCGR_SAMPLE_ID=MMETSP0209 /ASSEMBLY_ACC=CAM_ASM_000301 /LENGTH=286 /DNA_ID=CAMNT_0010816397 /DNA_START=58 /DNA_END=915 /DNA_ORIENTATION=+
MKIPINSAIKVLSIPDKTDKEKSEKSDKTQSQKRNTLQPASLKKNLDKKYNMNPGRNESKSSEGTYTANPDQLNAIINGSSSIDYISIFEQIQRYLEMNHSFIFYKNNIEWTIYNDAKVYFEKFKNAICDLESHSKKGKSGERVEPKQNVHHIKFEKLFNSILSLVMLNERVISKRLDLLEAESFKSGGSNGGNALGVTEKENMEKNAFSSNGAGVSYSEQIESIRRSYRKQVEINYDIYNSLNLKASKEVRYYEAKIEEINESHHNEVSRLKSRVSELERRLEAK